MADTDLPNGFGAMKPAAAGHRSASSNLPISFTRLLAAKSRLQPRISDLLRIFIALNANDIKSRSR
jgi:hypothetical protein